MFHVAHFLAFVGDCLVGDRRPHGELVVAGTLGSLRSIWRIARRTRCRSEVELCVLREWVNRMVRDVVTRVGKVCTGKAETR